MLLFDLGKLPEQQSMPIFHVLARMGIESLVIVSPRSSLVSIGYFQDAEQEVDLKYCKGSGIPFMRREGNRVPGSRFRRLCHGHFEPSC
jgi:lipoate-protein ligase A